MNDGGHTYDAILLAYVQLARVVLRFTKPGEKFDSVVRSALIAVVDDLARRNKM